MDRDDRDRWNPVGAGAAAGLPPRHTPIEWIKRTGEVQTGQYRAGGYWAPDGADACLMTAPAFWRLLKRERLASSAAAVSEPAIDLEQQQAAARERFLKMCA